MTAVFFRFCLLPDIFLTWHFGCSLRRFIVIIGNYASSSPVLTATSLSYGKAKNSTPHRIKTPDPIEIKFGRVDYVAEMTPHAKFHVNRSKGGFPANG